MEIYHKKVIVSSQLWANVPPESVFEEYQSSTLIPVACLIKT